MFPCFSNNESVYFIPDSTRSCRSHDGQTHCKNHFGGGSNVVFCSSLHNIYENICRMRRFFHKSVSPRLRKPCLISTNVKTMQSKRIATTTCRKKNRKLPHGTKRGLLPLGTLKCKIK